MARNPLNRLLKEHVAPELSEWALTRQMIYHAPVEWFLFGYCFTRSQMDGETFEVAEFGMPLFIRPESYIYSTYGGQLRVGEYGRWITLDRPDISTVFKTCSALLAARAPELRRKFRTPSAFLESLDSMPLIVHEEMRTEARAYTLALIGRKRLARTALDELIAMLERELSADNDPLDSTIASMKRAKRLRQLIDTDMAAVKALMERNRKASVIALGVNSLDRTVRPTRRKGQ